MQAVIRQRVAKVEAGLWQQLFQEYLDYMLGSYVMGLSSASFAGGVSSKPPWELVLHCDMEIRRQANKLVHKLPPLPASRLPQAAEQQPHSPICSSSSSAPLVRAMTPQRATAMT